MTTQQHKTQNKSGQIHQIATLIQIALRSKGAVWIRSGDYAENSRWQLVLRVTVATNGEEEAPVEIS